MGVPTGKYGMPAGDGVAATKVVSVSGGAGTAPAHGAVYEAMAAVRKFDSKILLQVLSERGGHPGALADAALLCAKKSEDYNQGMGHTDIHKVDRTSYFPFGAISYAQMLHTKVERFISLCKKPGAANFEGLKDTALDIINYSGFYVADPRDK